MSLVPEQITAAGKAHVEALLTLANTAFASAERFAALNLSVARTALEDAVANTKTLLEVKTPEALTKLQSDLAKPSMDKAVEYSRNVYEIANQTQEELSKVFEAQIAELNKNVAAAVDVIAAKAPAGSEAAISTIKSALAAANSAYDNISRTAKQVAETAQANVIAATNSAANAVSAPAPKAAAKKTAAAA